MAQARHFYGTFLGLPESGTTHQRYRVNANQAVEVDPLPRGVANHLEAVAFATADAEALRRYLLVQRIDVPDSVKRRADGAQWFWVKDPEGHRIEFVQLAVHARYMPVATHATEEPISSHILHAGFVVRDRAAEDHFFRDVLGFHEGWQGGMKDKQVDWVDMQVPNGTDWIEYMIHGPGPITPALSGVLNHFALGVPNMHEAMELLEQRGWHSTAREKAQIGRDGKWQLNLYDPDGTRVELMELRPVQIPCCSPYTLPAPK
jgi:catechol 2,3-dioxygenase-like lactoylglutathione lyase family enzyme